MPIPDGYHEGIRPAHMPAHVEALWSFVANAPEHSTILPDGRCDIILRFNLPREPAVTPVITGPATQPYMIEHQFGDTWVGARLTPGSDNLVWGRQLQGMANQMLRGPEAVTTSPALGQIKQAVPHTGQMHTRLVAALATIDPVKPPGIFEKASDLIHLTGGQARVGTLADTLGCSARHLSRLFGRFLGLSTKDYGQLVQFHRALNLRMHHHISINDVVFEA